MCLMPLCKTNCLCKLVQSAADDSFHLMEALVDEDVSCLWKESPVPNLTLEIRKLTFSTSYVSSFGCHAQRSEAQGIHNLAYRTQASCRLPTGNFRAGIRSRSAELHDDLVHDDFRLVTCLELARCRTARLGDIGCESQEKGNSTFVYFKFAKRNVSVEFLLLMHRKFKCCSYACSFRQSGSISPRKPGRRRPRCT